MVRPQCHFCFPNKTVFSFFCWRTWDRYPSDPVSKQWLANTFCNTNEKR